MSVSALYVMKLIATETPALGLDNADDVPFDHDIGVTNGTLTASSTVPATKAYSDDINLVAGQATIDLSNLGGPISSTVDFTGLKVQLVYITCPATNTGGITFDVGSSNGYNLFGADSASNESVEVMPGGAVFAYHPNNAQDVGAADEEIDVTGTGTEAFSILLVAG
jgi:hypothetical protein